MLSRTMCASAHARLPRAAAAISSTDDSCTSSASAYATTRAIFAGSSVPSTNAVTVRKRTASMRSSAVPSARASRSGSLGGSAPGASLASRPKIQ